MDLEPAAGGFGAAGPPVRQSSAMTSARRACVLLVAFLVAGACDTTIPSTSIATPEPSSAIDAEAVYDEIEAEVAAVRGLQPSDEVPRQVVTEEQMISRVRELFEADNPPEYVAASEKTLKALGLLERDASLQELYLEALRSQVLGFYSPEDDELFVVSRSGTLGPTEKATFAHEFTHALQDQRFDYWREADSWRDNGDLALARSSLVEGDATALMARWATEHMTAEENAQLLRDGLDPETLAVLAGMPAILREQLSFPYQQGFLFVSGLQGLAGWGPVDEAYDEPPSSTEQILHADKYRAGEPPIDVAPPAELAAELGEGWHVSLEDTLGEFQLSIWLREATTRVGPANEAAAGWGGDRMVLLDGPQGAWALAIISEWDDSAEAAQFIETAETAVEAGPFPGATAWQPGATRVTVMIASDRPTLTLLDAALGNTGV